MTDVTERWVAGLPKVELHVHVEGAILPETLMRLARKNRIDLPPKTLEELRDWYTFTDFPHFAEIYQTFSKAIMTPEDIHDLTWDFLNEQARQNIRHTEATFTALTHFKNHAIPFAEQMSAIRHAADKAKAELGVTLGLIIDIPREFATPEESLLTARWVAEAHGDGLVFALGLGGYEPGFPPEAFAKPFALAAEAGVPAIVHGGETGPAPYVRGAIETLGAIRVGHGVSAIDDADTMALIKDKGVTLEICPSSNVCLKVFKDMDSHPIRRIADSGVDVTINSDDPPMFNTDLNGEYFRVAQTFGYSKAEMKDFVTRAARASLASDATKAAIIAEISAYAG